MTRFRLLWRNLLYHWRSNLAVFLGITLGTAVLTGALLVGDSLRGSLRALTLDQLGWVEEAMVTPRFFREKLTEDMPAERKASAILLSAAAETGEQKVGIRRAGKVKLLAVDEQFWPADAVPISKEFWQSQEKEVVLNVTLANVLQVKVGDEVSLSVQKADAIPRESLLGKRNDVTQALTLRVKHILPDVGMARFTLKPSPEPVRNAFVPLKLLQDRLDFAGQANAILVGKTTGDLHSAVHHQLTLEDWNLRLRTPADRARTLLKFLDAKNKDGKLSKKKWLGRVPDTLAEQDDASGVLTIEQIKKFYEQHRGYISLESKQLFLEPNVENAAARLRWRPETWLVYLADTISVNGVDMPYAVVAAGSQVFAQGSLSGQIDLSLWPGAPWKAKTGDAVTLTYYVPDENNQLQKKQRTLKFRKAVELVEQDDDPDLTPEFPGITDQLDMRQWETPPFPYDARRISKQDELYWQRYRATPRAFVSLDTAQEMWGSRFGKHTSMHFYPIGKESLETTARDLHRDLLAALYPVQGGFVFQNMREQALQASGGSTDFGMYFLAFSFFLIAAALLLVGLLIRLGLDRRGPEIGVLLATGWSRRSVRWLLLAEGGMLAVVGGLVGLALALFYADLMIQLLQARWPGGRGLAFLHLHAEPSSFAIGYVASLFVSVATIFWATRVLGKMAPRALLAGESTASASRSTTGWLARGVLLFGVLGAIVCGLIGMEASDHMAKAGGFVGSGALLLSACIAALALWFGAGDRNRAAAPSLTRLGMRNAGRHRVRSLLTVGLLASATFLITAVEAFHKEVGADFAQKQGGSGGFALMAEATVPIFMDLDDPVVRNELGLTGFEGLGVKIHGLRLRAGDDTSCLNLYQPLKPRILGIPERLAQEPRFQFSAGLWTNADGTINHEEKANPWKLLSKPTGDGSIPIFVDANTAQYILKVGPKDMMETRNDQGAPVKLKVVGLLQESIFQSEVLMAEANFLKLFPRQEGFNFFLIDCASHEPAAIQSSLTKALADHGLEVTKTADRLQSYLAVENMYLATFQALGQLGLVLGALGLVIVLLRGVWERRAELALFQALGFRKGALAWLVLAENGFLLAAGLGIGALTAVVAVLPHVIGGGGALVWQRLALSLGFVVVVGLTAALAAVSSTLRAPILTALRRE